MVPSLFHFISFPLKLLFPPSFLVMTTRQGKVGITRKERSKIRDGKKILSWDYYDPKGNLINDPAVRDRCNKLAIPPAWREVWISDDETNYLQATGLDARDRLQYIYHAEWTAARAAEKFDGLLSFAPLLPKIRSQVERDLALKGMPKAKAVALVVKLMDTYHIRVGNDEYAKANKSYGLTTLKEGHVTIDRSREAEGDLDAIFEFKGKSGKQWKIRIWEDDLASLIVESGKVGGVDKDQDLFRYEDGNGHNYDIKSNHINEYLDSITPRNRKVTAKEFRTWAATWKMASRLASQLDPNTLSARKRVGNLVLKTVSEDLGNTPSVCRSSYVHPKVIADWLEGNFRNRWNKASKTRKKKGLSKEETVTLSYLEL